MYIRQIQKNYNMQFVMTPVPIEIKFESSDEKQPTRISDLRLFIYNCSNGLVEFYWKQKAVAVGIFNVEELKHPTIDPTILIVINIMQNFNKGNFLHL